MGRLEQAKSAVLELSSLSRVGINLPRFAGNRPWSAARILEERAEGQPHQIAILYLDERYTWREFDRKVNQYARYFQERGIGQGEVVALLMDNRPDYLFVVLALNRLRAITSLINTNASGAPLTHAINVCKAKALVVGSEHLDAVKEVLPTLERVGNNVWVQNERGAAAPEGFTAINDAVDAKDDTLPSWVSTPNGTEVMCYIYTSGTTGLPKAALITNKRFLGASYLYGAGAMHATQRDVIYLPLPLYHSNALMIGFGSAIANGAAVALRRKFSASQFWDDVRKFDATIFIYIGELCRYLLNAPKHPLERAHKLRVIVGNGMRPDAWVPFQQRFNVPLVSEFYAATEGNAIIINFEGRPGMLGRLKPGQVLVRCDEASGEIHRDKKGFCSEVEVGQKGILLGRVNPLVPFDGYVDANATNKKVLKDVFKKGDVYFNTGDLLQLHEDSWVSFADRVGDTFRWKGENVSTNEVAEVLNGAKGVLESNVYGVTVPGAEGRAGMASITASKDLDLGELARYVVNRLPGYQRPYFIRVAQQIQITGTFKHQKVSYREEGFDPNRVSEPLYYLDGSNYVPLDHALYQRIQAGEIGPR